MKLAITADLHVDAYGTRIDPESGINLRELDYLRTVEWVATQARDRGAAALIVAGDYTESKAPARGPRIARIARALSFGPDRQIHIRGNHDAEQAGDSIVSLLDRMRPGWTGFSQPGIEHVGNIAVCVIPFLSRSWLRSLDEYANVPDSDVFRALADLYVSIAAGLFARARTEGAQAVILIGHQQLSGGQMNDRQAAFIGDLDLVVDARALAAIGFDAIVFGHVHRAQTVLHSPAEVLFAGSVERVDFAEEREEKSFLMLDIEPGRLSIERIPTPARRYVTLSGDCRYAPVQVYGAIVRAVDVDPDLDVVQLRRDLEADEAFEVREIVPGRREILVSAAGLSESLTAEEALVAYFATDPEADRLIARGRERLQAVSA